MIRLLVNRAKVHFNSAVEKAEAAHLIEALADLDAALELDGTLADAHVLRGTILARLDRLPEAQDAWRNALSLNPQTLRAHRNIVGAGELRRSLPIVKRSVAVAVGCVVTLLVFVASIKPWNATKSPASATHADPVVSSLSASGQMTAGFPNNSFGEAWKSLLAGRVADATSLAETLPKGRERETLFAAIEDARKVEREKVERETRSAAEELIARIEKFAEAGNLEEVQAARVEFDKLPANFPELSSRMDAMETRAQAVRREALLASFNAALDREDATEILATAERLTTAGIAISPDALPRIADARRSLAIQSYYAIMQLAPKADTATLSEDEARQIVQWSEQTRDALPERLRIRAESNIREVTEAALKVLNPR